METVDSKKSFREGLISSIICQVWWGIMPIYWHLIRDIDSWIIILYRILLVAVVSFIAARFKYSVKEIIEPLKNKKVLIRIIIAGLLIATNWSIYIYVVNADMVIQSCIGYYLEPLIICAFGFLIFKEKINKFKIIALVMGAIGLLAVMIYFGKFPTLAILLGITFAVYTAVKKGLSLPPLLSLFYETIFLAPFALIAIVVLETKGMGALSQTGLGTYFLMYLCGLFTFFPLTVFANAANKVSMFVLGVTEYISPSLALILSIFYFKEDFEPIQIIAFIVIWIGLIIFTIGEYKEFKKGKIEI